MKPNNMQPISQQPLQQPEFQPEFTDLQQPKAYDSKVVLAVIVCLVMIILGLTIALIVAFSTRGDTHNEPTPELARSVCKEYDGILYQLDNNPLLYESYSCGSKESSVGFMPNGTKFLIGFFEDKNKEEIWSQIRSANYKRDVVLEDSDDFIKAYSDELTETGTVRTYIIVYNNAMLSLSVHNDSVAEEMIKELGFFNGRRAD